jgi:Mn-dependent DtxR family transcriptional regulator
MAVPDYTPKQGQYLAFIYYYTKINRRPLAEADIQRYFGVTPPTVHQM